MEHNTAPFVRCECAKVSPGMLWWRNFVSIQGWDACRSKSHTALAFGCPLLSDSFWSRDWPPHPFDCSFWGYKQPLTSTLPCQRFRIQRPAQRCRLLRQSKGGVPAILTLLVAFLTTGRRGPSRPYGLGIPCAVAVSSQSRTWSAWSLDRSITASCMLHTSCPECFFPLCLRDLSARGFGWRKAFRFISPTSLTHG